MIRARLVGLSLVAALSLVGCRKKEQPGDDPEKSSKEALAEPGVGPMRVPRRSESTIRDDVEAPREKRAPRLDDETLTAFLELYASDMVEVADRVEKALSGAARRKSKDDPRSPFLRIPSPALGTTLAARQDVIDLEVLHTGSTHVIVQRLRGGHTSPGHQKSAGPPLERDKDRLVAMCPPLNWDDEDAVDLTLRRGATEDARGFTLRATVRGKGICLDPAERTAREGEVARARAFVGANEAAYRAYVEAASAVCERPLAAPQAPLQPGDVGKLPGFLGAQASCTRGDSGLHRSLLSASSLPVHESPRHVGHYRPGPGRYFGLEQSRDGASVLEVHVTAPSGNSAEASFYFAAPSP